METNVCKNCDDENCACLSLSDEAYNEHMQQESLTLQYG